MADEGHTQGKAGASPEASPEISARQRVVTPESAGGAGAEAVPSEPAVEGEAAPSAQDEAAQGEDAGGESTAAHTGSEAEDAAPESGTPVETLEEELAQTQRAAQEHLDRALRAESDRLRALAELENVRRRMARDVENAHKFALERFVSELLPVKDSLELGLAAVAEPGAGAESIAEGVGLTLRMFEQAMDKFGVRPIDPAGEPFDPEFHQAMTMQESDTAESGTVLTVIQKGYALNERLVRPAMVIVAK